MKKLLTSLLALALIASSIVLASCNEKEEAKETEAPETNTETAAATEVATEAVTEAATEAVTEATTEAVTETEAPATVEGSSLTSLVDVASVVSANENYKEEVPANLFDEDENTKWCLNYFSDDHPVVTFKTTKAVKVNGFEFWTANDTAEYPNRNPLHIVLSGSNDDGATWTVISDRDVEMESENFTPSEIFAVENNSGSYTMFKLEVTEIVGGSGTNILQISQFNLIGVEA